MRHQCPRRLLIFAITLIGTNILAAAPDKILHLKKISAGIIIDGVIDPVWNQADSVADFVQLQPFAGKEPSVRTVAKLLTTEEAMYCLMVCYEEKKNIQKNTGKLDDFGGDIVSLMLDTFGDKRTAYKFAVTASGVRADCRLLDDARNRDYSWDSVWFADAKVHDWGFVIEMKIPYRSIQYYEHLTEWGLDFDRWIPARTEDIYWCRYEENEGQRISKFGKLMFQDFRPSVKGLNLEVYPVGIAKATYSRDSKYDVNPDAGIDIFYNPSQRLTFQLTANPDFAQIEADPFSFNISRYESYFDERRPFFTEGNEIFMPSGRQHNTGFYRPLELFYSRRIGKKLPDGNEVLLLFGTKAFGRLGSWEYGGFLALTGEQDYTVNGEKETEPRAAFASARIKKQILGNSSVGMLFVGKRTEEDFDGVLDIDGAFRTSDWQLSYQLARSFKNDQGDFGCSAGFFQLKENWITGVRGRYIRKDFDVNQVGFVPWKGTGELTAIPGPRWYFNEGTIRQILIYTGGSLNYERVDAYTDRSAVLGFNMQFRKNWGYEITFISGRSKDQNKKFTSYEIDYSSWFNISPKWNANLYGGYARTYNFARDYLAFYSWMGSSLNWQMLKVLEVGTSLNAFVEEDPDNQIEDVTWNARPYFSLTPINNLNIRTYVDNVYVRSTDGIQRVIAGFLFSYNFSPKSWIYFAINEIRDRSDEYDSAGHPLPNRLHVTDRVGVFKIKYLYYF
ncbi:MAG: carbohydrate binding family 9 domain-containing protein [candidate division KSB1 bacterium]|nr:carbohydrate binding family 9 domain-containing protein [candidate division KSB1 bacterium]MDZ7302705.1 carbohydrate binding family 9 domain-containing protein [candidate division KSB1 bacterium]MDZ7311764.1 carbohydrate binding family 9 domain-containing protein [candidate division KSB1 bacterium]